MNSEQESQPTILPLLFWVLALFLTLLLVASSFLVTVQGEKPHLSGIDANFAYSWLGSGYLDQDLDFENDFRFLTAEFLDTRTRSYFYGYLHSGPRTSVDGPANLYGLGSCLLALPIYSAIDHAIPVLFQDPPASISKFSPIYPLAFMIAGLIFGFVALALTYRLLTEFFSDQAAFTAIFFIAIGSPLFYLLRYEQGNPALFSYALSTIYVLACLKLTLVLSRFDIDKNVFALFFAALLTGIFLGLLCSIRATNILFAIIPLFLIRRVLRDSGGKRKAYLGLGAIGLFALFLSGAVIGYAPQIYAWKIHLGSLAILKPALIDFSPSLFRAWVMYFKMPYGLFVMCPIVALGLLGLVVGVMRSDALAISGLIVTTLGLVVYASWNSFVLPDNFGMRNIAEYSIFIAFGLAELVDGIRTNSNRYLFIVLAFALSLPYLAITFASRYGLELSGESALRIISVRREDILKQAGKDFNLLGLIAAKKQPMLYESTTASE